MLRIISSLRPRPFVHRFLEATQAGGVRSRQLTLFRKVVSEYRLEPLQQISESEAANSAQRKRPDPATGSGLCAGLVMQMHQPIATTYNNK